MSLIIRVATYYINAISGKSRQIMDFCNALNIDVVGLTETWLRPPDRFVLPQQYEAVTVPPVGQQYRGHKEVALAVRHTVSYKREATP